MDPAATSASAGGKEERRRRRKWDVTDEGVTAAQPAPAAADPVAAAAAAAAGAPGAASTEAAARMAKMQEIRAKAQQQAAQIEERIKAAAALQPKAPRRNKWGEQSPAGGGGLAVLTPGMPPKVDVAAINALLQAKGLSGIATPSNPARDARPLHPEGSVDLNSCPSGRIRNILTKGSVQSQIQRDTGAAVTTRGRFYPSPEIPAPGQHLHLRITGDTQEQARRACTRSWSGAAARARGGGVCAVCGLAGEGGTRPTRANPLPCGLVCFLWRS